MVFLEKLLYRIKEQASAGFNKNRSADSLACIQKINAIFLNNTELGTALEQALKELLQTLKLEVGAIYLLNSRLEELYLVAAGGIEQKQLQVSYKIGEGLVGRVAIEQKPLTINRPQTSKLIIKTILGIVLPATLLHQPIIYRQKLIGVLVVGGAYPLSQQTQTELKILTESLALGLQHLQCQRQMQAQMAELERVSFEFSQQREAVRNLKLSLDQVSQSRNNFLSIISHELRTPLTSILGFSQLSLRDFEMGQLKQRHKNNLERVVRNGQTLLNMINNILDLTRLEAGKTELNIDNTNLADFLEAIVNDFRLAAAAKEIELGCNLPNELIFIETDQTKLRQIIVNLVANAIKFTNEGGHVEISVRRFYQQEEKVAITVSDTGIGIETDKQTQIFDQFYQMDDTSTRKYGGAGLGLAVVNQLVSLLGGTVELQSEKEKGSRFTIILPTHETIKRATPIPPAQPPKKVYAPYILVVDDEADIREMLEQAINSLALRVKTAQNGLEALQQIEKEKPALVLLDLMMPVMDGFETLERLRANPQFSNLPIFVLTARALNSGEIFRLRANANRVIQKGNLALNRVMEEVKALV